MVCRLILRIFFSGIIGFQLIGYKLSVRNYWLIIICYPLSVINYRLSIIGYEYYFFMNYRSKIIGYELSFMNYSTFTDGMEFQI